MESALIVSANEKAIRSALQLLQDEGIAQADSAQSGSSARKQMSEQDYELLLVIAPLSDESAEAFAADAAEHTAVSVLLLVDGTSEEETEARMLPYGVPVLGRPVSKRLLSKVLHLLEAESNRLKGMQQENVRLHKKIDDSRIINRAKAILTEYLNMTEPQAHKYLERQAMELRVTKLEVAKRLLSTYEN